MILKQLQLCEQFIRKCVFFPSCMQWESAVPSECVHPRPGISSDAPKTRCPSRAPLSPPAALDYRRHRPNINFWACLWTGTDLITRRLRCSSPLISQLVAPFTPTSARSPYVLHSNRAPQGRARMQCVKPEGSCRISSRHSVFQIWKSN